ncbi:MAG: hypothetical protein EOM23_03555 [Candidatus Moranbacteria bacterium]|nr:hypothetical protein [Candidatus Moranbacteria bacterium]
MEGETEASINSQLRLFNDRVLPTLDNNIKSGNSLVDTDFYDNKLDFGEERKIKPFNWQKAFPQVFNRNVPSPEKDQLKSLARKAKHHAAKAWEYAGELESKIDIVSEAVAGYGNKTGFDVVIGNPPYVVIEGEFRNDVILAYFRQRYKSASYKIDLYHLFFERGLLLLRENGKLGFITPANFLSNNGLAGLRETILANSFIEIINQITGKVFTGASVDTAITILSKSTNLKKSLFIHSNCKSNELTLISSKAFDQSVFKSNEGKMFIATSEITKLKVHTFELGERFFVKFGMQLRDRKKFKSDVISTGQKELITDYHRPCYTGKDVNKWIVRYGDILAYFNKTAKRGGCWDEKIHNAAPKLIVRQIGAVPVFGIDLKGYCCLNTVFMVVPKEKSEIDLKFLLGILNSKFIANYWSKNFSDLRTTFPKIKGRYLEKLPIPIMDDNQPEPKKAHDDLVNYVDQILQLNEEKDKTKLQSKILQIDEKIEYCENRINQIVYQLYDLTEEEIKTVEGKYKLELT